VSRRRAHIGTIVVALIAIGIVVAATRISRRLFETPDSAATSGDRHTAIAAPTAPPPPGVDESRVFEVMSATGKVEAQRGDGWAPIRQGDKLTRSDIVRTSVASGAVLRLAAGARGQRELAQAGVELVDGIQTPSDEPGLGVTQALSDPR